MIHPLLQLIATQPQLLADHAEAYGEMLAVEVEVQHGQHLALRRLGTCQRMLEPLAKEDAVG